MKKRDLMIGDWVELNEIHAKVTGITDAGVHFVDRFGGGIASGADPIPLTPEILEKNGFGKDKNGDFVLIEDDYAVRVMRRGDVYAFTLVVGRAGITDMIRFTVHQVGPFSVHWVQHALKLCGIKKEIVL